MGGRRHIEWFSFINMIGSALVLLARQVAIFYYHGAKCLAQIREAGGGIIGFVLQKLHANHAKTTLLCKIHCR
jgi:hypothetical protein